MPIKKTQNLGITIMNSTTVDSFSENPNSVQVKTNHFEFNSSKLIITTNGFTNQLFKILNLHEHKCLLQTNSRFTHKGHFTWIVVIII